ncbi:MAG: TIM barrel protein, partial [Oscillospiraceae bacterium]
EDKGVTPLIETNGILANSVEMRKFMEAIKSENKGVLWDIHHPFRYFGERPEETYQNIGEFVKYTHVKDSIMQGDKLSYRMMGYGDVPIFDALKILKENGYDGYVSLEWVKRWNPDLEDAGIVFAHFMSYITFLMDRLYI